MAPTITPDAASPVYEQVRRWPRHKIDVPVRAVIHKPDKTLIRDGRGMEVSEGGMCLMCQLMGVELGLGDEIEVEFTPPYSGKPIRVRSEVRNRNGYQLLSPPLRLPLWAILVYQRKSPRLRNSQFLTLFAELLMA